VISWNGKAGRRSGAGGKSHVGKEGPITAPIGLAKDDDFLV